MHLGRGAVAERAQVVAVEDVEHLDEGDAAGGRRRRADDGVAAIRAGDGLALFGGVAGHVFGGDEAAALLDGVGDLFGHGAVVEVVGVTGDVAQRVGEFGLLECFAGLVEIAVALEDVLRSGEAGEDFVVQRWRLLRR